MSEKENILKLTAMIKDKGGILGYSIETYIDQSDKDASEVALLSVGKLKTMGTWLQQIVTKPQIDSDDKDFTKQPIPEQKPLGAKYNEDQWKTTILPEIEKAKWYPWKNKPDQGGSTHIKNVPNLNNYILQFSHIGWDNAIPIEGYRYMKYKAQDNFIQRGKM